MKNVVADSLCRLDIEEVARPVEKVSTLLDTAVETNIKFPFYHEQLKSEGLRENAADQPHDSFQNIEQIPEQDHSL